MLASGERRLELQDEHARRRQHDEHRAASVMKIAYCPRLSMMSLMSASLALPLSRRLTRGQAAQPGETQQRREPEHPQRRDRAEEVQPASPVDPVRTLRLGARDVDREVDEEHDADQVVVEQQGLDRRFVQRQQQRDHDGQRQDGQDQDEDVVGVAVLRQCRVLACRHLGFGGCLGHGRPQCGWRFEWPRPARRAHYASHGRARSGRRCVQLEVDVLPHPHHDVERDHGSVRTSTR